MAQINVNGIDHPWIDPPEEICEDPAPTIYWHIETMTWEADVAPSKLRVEIEALKASRTDAVASLIYIDP